jgi:hypothetical protein
MASATLLGLVLAEVFLGRKANATGQARRFLRPACNNLGEPALYLPIINTVKALQDRAVCQQIFLSFVKFTVLLYAKPRSAKQNEDARSNVS